MRPGMTTVSPSETASTSTSVPKRYLSTSTVPRDPPTRSPSSGRAATAAATKRWSWSREWTISTPLPPELDDHAARPLGLDDGENRLLVEGLEVEAGAAIEVGADRLRVAVDHDRRHTLAAQRLGGLDAAVIELDALTDADGPAAEHHHRIAVGQRPLVLGLDGGVVVGGGRGEFGGAGVDALEGGGG